MFCYNNGRTLRNIESIDWIMKLQKLGVGEIIVTFIDFDGTGNGFDVSYIKSLKKNKLSPGSKWRCWKFNLLLNF